MNFYKKIGSVLHVCRACLTLSKEVQLIFGKNQNETESMLRALSIELIDNDVLSKYLCLPCVEKIKSLYSFVEMFKNSQKIIQEALQSDGRNTNKNEIEGRHEWNSSEIIDCDSPSPPSQTTIQVGPSVCPRNNEPEQTCRVSVKSEFNKSHEEQVEGPLETFAHTSRATIRQDLFAREQQKEQVGGNFNQGQAYIPEWQRIQAELSVEEQQNNFRVIESAPAVPQGYCPTTAPLTAYIPRENTLRIEHQNNGTQQAGQNHHRKVIPQWSRWVNPNFNWEPKQPTTRRQRRREKTRRPKAIHMPTQLG